MMRWDSRPPEVAHALNPAFCGASVRACVSGHSLHTGLPMPYPLCYLVLPIVLHRKTRESLPSSLSRRRMHDWLADNPHALIGFGQRARSMVPFTREALVFLIDRRIVRAASDGGIEDAGDARRAAACGSRRPSREVDDCAKAAKTVGRWFASSGGTDMIFRMWGVRP